MNDTTFGEKMQRQTLFVFEIFTGKKEIYKKDLIHSDDLFRISYNLLCNIVSVDVFKAIKNQNVIIYI